VTWRDALYSDLTKLRRSCHVCLKLRLGRGRQHHSSSSIAAPTDADTPARRPAGRPASIFDLSSRSENLQAATRAPVRLPPTPTAHVTNLTKARRLNKLTFCPCAAYWTSEQLLSRQNYWLWRPASELPDTFQTRHPFSTYRASIQHCQTAAGNQAAGNYCRNTATRAMSFSITRFTAILLLLTLQWTLQ